MKTSESKIKIGAIILTGLFFASLGGLVVMHDSKTSLEDLLNGSKLKNESLLSEKLMGDKEISDLKNQITIQRGKNKEMEKLLAQANASIAKKESELKKNPGNKNTSKELAELKRIKNDLEQEKSALNTRIQNLENDRDNLNQQLLLAQNKNKELANTVNIMEAMAINNYRIDATKKNEKLTVVARKTRNLTMAFDFPQDIASNIKFKVKTPDGKVISEDDASLVSEVIESTDNFTASLQMGSTGELKVNKRVQMSYKPEQKLKKGVYTIDIMNGSTYISSCQVRLR